MAEHPQSHLVCNLTLFFFNLKAKKREMAFVKIVAYSTKYSQAVTHPSTNSAQCCLTTVIRQELVYSTWYGCKHLQQVKAMSKSKCQRRTAKVWHTASLFFFLYLKFMVLLGDSANAVSNYQKLCTQVTHIWGNCRGQPILSAMEKPHPRGTTFLIMVDLRAR